MKILIIGGTGTISAPITRALAADPDNTVYMLNRGRHSDPFGDSIIRLRADIHDTEAAEQILPQVTFDSVIDFIPFTREDAERRTALLKNRTKQYIFISTNVAADHEYRLIAEESLPLGNSYSRYGTNKAEAEKYFREADIPYTIVRPTQTYSDARIPLSVKPGNCWAVVSRILRDQPVIVHGDGEGIWAGTHADDFARAFIPLVGNTRTLGETYQIVNPEPYTWNMLYHTLGELLGKETKIVHIPTEFLMRCQEYDFTESIRGDKYHSVLFDIRKLEEVTGKLHFATDMRTGLQKYLAYMDEHPELKTEDPDFDAWCDRVITAYKEASDSFAEYLLNA